MSRNDLQQRAFGLLQQLKATSTQRPWFHSQLFSITHCRRHLRPARQVRQLSTPSENEVSRGKRQKDEFKARRLQSQRSKIEAGSPEYTAKIARWDLAVGLEIHAQLKTERKLFSRSRTSYEGRPNTNVTFFDLAFPGSQPIFQRETLLPALRAAIALSCQIQLESRFDRKHYFYPDQPAGYQITQYYHPFALKGHVSLQGSDSDDLREHPYEVGIKQIQLEQDTAKSISEPPSITLIDFNRVGHPLIEIITHPHLHSPSAAAGCAKKIMSILQAVNAVNVGMEMGGLRADVNVSVSPKGSSTLGQRTEIKNVSSFKAIEQAIVAERDRQIDLLESGGSVKSETRGWTLGDTQTTRLRGKEGEVDYRYMPDPDVPPLLIDLHLVSHIRERLPPLPDEIAHDLVAQAALTPKDARTLVALDDGLRLGYFDDVCDEWLNLLPSGNATLTPEMMRMAGNWVIHELGGQLTASSRSFTEDIVPAESLARILSELHSGKITGTSAKRLLAIIFDDNRGDVVEIIEEQRMMIKQLTNEEYLNMAQTVITQNPNQAMALKKGQKGKLKFLVGQMMRASGGTVDARKAEIILQAIIESDIQAS